MGKTKIFGAVIALMVSTLPLNAQSFGNIFSSGTASDVVSTVTGGLTVTSSNIVGRWEYVEPTVELSSDSALTSVAGSVAASQLESKFNTYCSKVGITAGKFAFVFNEDGTFTSDMGGKSLGGSYEVDSESGKITLSYKVINSINVGTLAASTTLTTNSLSLLFQADKLLKFISTVASVSSTPEFKALSTITEQYNGISLGFSLSGNVVVGSGDVTTVVNDVEKAVSAFGKFF